MLVQSLSLYEQDAIQENPTLNTYQILHISLAITYLDGWPVTLRDENYPTFLRINNGHMYAENCMKLALRVKSNGKKMYILVNEYDSTLATTYMSY